MKSALTVAAEAANEALSVAVQTVNARRRALRLHEAECDDCAGVTGRGCRERLVLHANYSLADSLYKQAATHATISETRLSGSFETL